jgi:hypothetical protein
MKKGRCEVTVWRKRGSNEERKKQRKKQTDKVMLNNEGL